MCVCVYLNIRNEFITEMSVIHISYILEIIQFGTDKKVESNLSSWDTKNVGHLVTETLYQKMDKNYSTIWNWQAVLTVTGNVVHHDNLKWCDISFQSCMVPIMWFSAVWWKNIWTEKSTSGQLRFQVNFSNFQIIIKFHNPWRARLFLSLT